MPGPLTRSSFVAALVATLCAVGGPVRADAPPASEWPIERNAQTLGRREWTVGLWGFDGGATDWLQIGTLWVPWGLAAPNIHLKARLFHRGQWTMSTELSFFAVNLDNLAWYGQDDLSGRLYDLPLGLALDWEAHPRLLVGLSTSYAPIMTTPPFDATGLKGSGAYDTFVLSGHLTARAAPRWWLVAEADWVLYQGLVAVGDVSGQTDDYTTVSGSAQADVAPISPGRGGAITLSSIVRAGSFGFRIGGGYGNWVVPRLRGAFPDRIPIVLFDIYARFGGRTADADEVSSPVPSATP